MAKKKEYKDELYPLDYSGYILLQHMYTIHDSIRGLDDETQEKLSEFVYYLAHKFEPTLNGWDIEEQELCIKYHLSKNHK